MLAESMHCQLEARNIEALAVDIFVLFKVIPLSTAIVDAVVRRKKRFSGSL